MDIFDKNGEILNPSVLTSLVFITLLGHILPLIWNIKKIPEILWSLPSFLFYSPTYIHLFVIYAFCRIDDLSWGTKGLDSSKNEENIK